MSVRTTEAVRNPDPSSHTAQQRSSRIKLRRAVTFMGMTLLLPGSAQMAAGNKRVGRLALRIWSGLIAVVITVGILALLWPSGAVALFTSGAILRGIQVGLVLAGLGWALLLVDAWRISRPPDLARQHRIYITVVNLVLIMAVISGLVASASMFSAQRNLVTAVFTGGGDTTAKAGRYNILLMGGDAGKNRVGLRPDSMTVASVDAETGRTVLISLPRNLERVPFPSGSPMHKAYPRGYYCSDRSCMLNAVYTYAMAHPELYPGVQNPGAEATKEAIEGVTGLPINYWVLLDMKGFESLVNAVGGITMDVYRRVPIGGGSTPVSGYVEAGKNRHLNGREALWFARSRVDSSDYDRMVRQKCVMNAMLNELDPLTVLTKFNRIASAGQEIMATDIPTSDLSTMARLALAAKQLPVSSVAFMPPLIEPANPDFGVVRATVAAKIERAEAADQKAVQPTETTKPSAAAQPTAATQPSAAAQPTAGSAATPQRTKPKQPEASGVQTRGPVANDLNQICTA
ncbi:MAG TPA: LCP family protein [Propionibacteriaceae bacterium]|nr:LCP family protein [Propionibacteriaceae bacterium]